MDGTGRLFAPFRAALGLGAEVHVVAYPSQRTRSYDQLLSDIDVPDGPFAVVAESFSGPLGIRLATRFPNQVRALTLVASFAQAPSAVARWIPPLAPKRLLEFPLPDLAIRFAMLGMDASPQELAEVRAALETVSRRVLADRLRAISMVDVRRNFATVEAPLLYLAGSRDRLVGPKTRSDLSRLRPEMMTAVLDAPHMVLQRSPVEAARIVSAFLSSNSGSDSSSKQGPCWAHGLNSSACSR